MKIAVQTSLPAFQNDIGDVVRLFYGEGAAVEETQQADARLTHIHEEADGEWRETFVLTDCSGRTERNTLSAPAVFGGLEEKRQKKRLIKRCCYMLFKRLSGRQPAWGSLTGIRPTRLYYQQLENGKTRGEARHTLQDLFDLSQEKIDLLDEILDAQQGLMDRRARACDVYIGIPFCTTRCAYCSFVSQSIERFGAFLPAYLDALLREIAHTGALLKNSGFHIRTLYMGGGTPTTLSSTQMARLLDAINRNFDLSRCLEFTVEGGRPDTLDPQKLCVIKDGGATRISINPQTMSDKVLEAVGRRHTARQTVEAYEQAVQAGFDDINMDLIAGLPADDAASFADSIRQVLDLNPSNITVHTLALKKGAALFGSRMELPPQEAVAAMLTGAEDALRQSGYEPYYLYRQKYMSGSFENTGWCRPGYTGLYNIYMMEELHTILSLGGGGMNKINLPEEKLARYHNPKIPQDYISRIDTILQQKDEIFSILRGLREQNP